MDKEHDRAPDFDVEITPLSDLDDDSDLTDETTTSTTKIKALRMKIKALDADKRQLMEDLQRARADFLNSKRRLEEQKAEDIARTTDRHIEKLLPLYDSFALSRANSAAWSELSPTWQKGIDAMFAQLESLFRDYGLAVVNETGKPFDPTRHEAIQHVPVTTADAHEVVQTVVQVGIIRTTPHGTILIRPARVTVGNFEQQ